MPKDLQEASWQKNPKKASEQLGYFITPEILKDKQSSPSLNELFNTYLHITHWKINEAGLWSHESHGDGLTYAEAIAARILDEWQMIWTKALAPKS